VQTYAWASTCRRGFMRWANFGTTDWRCRTCHALSHDNRLNGAKTRSIHNIVEPWLHAYGTQYGCTKQSSRQRSGRRYRICDMATTRSGKGPKPERNGKRRHVLSSRARGVFCRGLAWRPNTTVGAHARLPSANIGRYNADGHADTRSQVFRQPVHGVPIDSQRRSTRPAGS